MDKNLNADQFFWVLSRVYDSVKDGPGPFEWPPALDVTRAFRDIITRAGLRVEEREHEEVDLVAMYVLGEQEEKACVFQVYLPTGEIVSGYGTKWWRGGRDQEPVEDVTELFEELVMTDREWSVINNALQRHAWWEQWRNEHDR